MKIDYDVHSGCWNWTGKRDKYGYGRAWIDGKERFAHRILYELCVGPIPEGHDLHHKVCENKSCVSPFHTVPVPHADHTKLTDRKKNGDRQLAKTRCPRDHEYDRVYVKPNGRQQRVCTICKRINKALKNNPT